MILGKIALRRGSVPNITLRKLSKKNRGDGRNSPNLKSTRLATKSTFFVNEHIKLNTNSIHKEYRLEILFARRGLGIRRLGGWIIVDFGNWLGFCLQIWGKGRIKIIIKEKMSGFFNVL